MEKRKKVGTEAFASGKKKRKKERKERKIGVKKDDFWRITAF